MLFDVVIVGAGPAGAACAALCAQAGLKTALVERTIFPREKVCGDCLNPACWPILDRLSLSERVLQLAHSVLESVEFIDLQGRALSVPLAPGARGEIAIKRSLLDQLLLARAQELGAHAFQDHAVTHVDSGDFWTVHAGKQIFHARKLVAADGRNSTVARLLGRLPKPARDRIGLQTHIPAPAGFGARVALRFLPHGYCGMASVGEAQLNLCLVGRAQNIESLKGWANAHFKIPADHPWRTISPLARAPVTPLQGNLYLVGDAARVVEPFTGEGIYYALASGELAANHLISGTDHAYPAAHRALYRGRLWVNEFSRYAATHPKSASLILGIARVAPGILRALTTKVVGSAAR